MTQCSEVNLVVHRLQNVLKKWLKNTLASVCLYPHNPGNQNRKVQVMNEFTRSSLKLYKYDYKSKL